MADEGIFLSPSFTSSSALTLSLSWDQVQEVAVDVILVVAEEKDTLCLILGGLPCTKVISHAYHMIFSMGGGMYL